MAAIKKDFGSGGAGLHPESSEPTLASALRDIADDLAGVKGGAVAAAAAAATAVADVSATAAADAAVTAVADAAGDVGAGALANDLKAKYNDAVTLINELKADLGEARALVNDLKAKYNAMVTLVNELRSDANTENGYTLKTTKA